MPLMSVGPHQVMFGYWQDFRTTVDLPRAREDDFRARIVIAAGFEDGQLAATVDLEVRVRDPACCRCD